MNTDYTNSTNVDVWLCRYIRVIRDIRVPLNYVYGVGGGRVCFLNTDDANSADVGMCGC